MWYDKGSEVQPNIFSTNQRHCLISPKMPRYYVVVIVLEYLESKIVSLGDIDSAIESKETIVGVGPSWVARVSEMFLS